MGFRKSYNRWKNRKINEKAAEELKFFKALATLGTGNLDKVVKNIPHSKSQFYQDLFALSILDFKIDGYFVEFGAEDGINISNSYLLEKKFGWNGILAEPSRGPQNELLKNRDVHIDFDCVWQSSNENVTFWELEFGSMSGMKTSLQNRTQIIGKHLKTRKSYTVNTVSLNDLLKRYDAPYEMDYLSIDTEGTELEILNTFDFNKYSFSVITIEHNYTSDREGQYELLTKNGYKRILENVSKIDDWYIRN
ncbi:MAG: FkbM family methyltransferase [Paracoccaceae bacterium]|nr:FkbM family methyltransferase [Paracoccaceae bacterium]MDE2674623.1 FkbM family methyltransferase [Paracoccaceae bacterium]